MGYLIFITGYDIKKESLILQQHILYKKIYQPCIGLDNQWNRCWLEHYHLGIDSHLLRKNTF